MRSRRSIMIFLIQATGALITAPQLVCRAWAQPAQQAVSFVGSTTDQLVKIVNSPDPPQEKRRSLQRVIDRTVDVNDIGQFCIGRFWRIATPAQRQEYRRPFGDLLVTEIAAHLGEYQGVRVNVGLAQAAEDIGVVRTTTEHSNNPTSQVDWIISTATGGPKIVDLLAEGTSLRLTQSSDFAAYIARHQYNIQELIEGMRQLIAQ